MPILSSTASDLNGICYNVNADNVASKVAIALGQEGWFTDVQDYLKTQTKNPAFSLPVNEVGPLKDEGVISGMLRR